MKHNNILLAWRLLYFTYGLFPIIVGLDKYFNFLADWSIYINPYIPQFFHITTPTFMHIFAIMQITTGLLIFLRPIIGGYIITLLLMVITVDLLSTAQYDTAMRAIAMTIGAYVFVLLSRELRNPKPSKDAHHF
jgi:hypothetical protein